jgi:predicted ArsR family transcriptional regulator
MDAMGAVSALADPVRAAVYDIVAASDEPIGRDLVSERAGLARGTAAFHLDRLAASGLLDVSYARPAGRTGPGAGRPAKLYRRSGGEISVSVPERSYDLMGALLASAIERSTANGRPVLDELRAAATDAGRAAGATAATFADVLDATGYEPAAGPDGIVMMNCPFHRLAAAHTDVVCAANHAFLCGAAEGSGADPDAVVLQPGAGRCCVHIAAAE